MQPMDYRLKEGLVNGDNQAVLDYLKTNPSGFDGTRLIEETFPNLVLKDITIKDVDWSRVSLTNATLINVTFDGGTFEGVDFSYSYLEGVRFLNMTMEPYGQHKPDRRDTRFTGSQFNRVGFAKTQLFNVMLDKLKEGSQLSLLDCQIAEKLEASGHMFYEAQLKKFVIDQCDIKKVSLNYIEGADLIVIKNSHIDEVFMGGVIANKVELLDNKKLYMYTGGQVNSVVVNNNNLMSLFSGFDTPLLKVYNNQFDPKPSGSILSIDGKVKLVDIKGCENEGTINITDTNIDKILINDCNMKDFRAFDSNINEAEINNSSMGEFVAFNVKANDFSFNNASLNQQAVAVNAVINNFDLSGLSISPDLIYEDEGYSLFHPGEVKMPLVSNQ